MTVNRSGEIVQANGTFGDMIGSSLLAGIARFLDLLRPGDRIFWETHIVPLLDMQGFVREIAIELRTTGEPLPALLNARNQRPGEPDSLIDLAIFSARDRRSYEQELLAARKQAEAAEAHARNLAETLQRSLIPPSLPKIPGLEVGAAYRPAGLGDEIGGDFYDFFRVNPTEWVIALGDVCGKGARAAAITALVRFTVRGAAMETDDLSDALQTVNRTLLLDQGAETCTALLARFRPLETGHRARIVSAGHPFPRLIRRSGEITSVGGHGPLLGAYPGISHTVARVVLGAGDTLVMFTDGIVEARRGGDFFGDHGLDSLLAEHAGAGAEALASTIANTIVEFQDGSPRDDVAVVVVKEPLT
ncbi:MAG: SpoIIE family protein phosphatase [Acidimicrobiia bacterium]|nr:serine/threonine-protein phosphatase [Acidimicrobiia bacterium]NNF10594.1 SpoIIE family protein phosphatase [Acidimicrobiia bacterium]NNL70818.1 SpoIIE family protein phosphatase [Acidimicrobiia bacterium]